MRKLILFVGLVLASTSFAESYIENFTLTGDVAYDLSKVIDNNRTVYCETDKRITCKVNGKATIQDGVLLLVDSSAHALFNSLNMEEENSYSGVIKKYGHTECLEEAIIIDRVPTPVITGYNYFCSIGMWGNNRK